MGHQPDGDRVAPRVVLVELRQRVAQKTGEHRGVREPAALVLEDGLHGHVVLEDRGLRGHEVAQHGTLGERRRDRPGELLRAALGARPPRDDCGHLAGQVCEPVANQAAEQREQDGSTRGVRAEL